MPVQWGLEERSSVDVSLQAILSDATFCLLVERYILKIVDPSEELRELTDAICDCLVHKKAVKFQMEVLDPASFSFGEPPK